MPMGYSPGLTTTAPRIHLIPWRSQFGVCWSRWIAAGSPIMAQHRADPLTKYLERPLVRGIDAASGHDVHGSPLDAGQQKLRLVHRLNEAADVVTENLAVDLILHRGLGLA